MTKIECRGRARIARVGMGESRFEANAVFRDISGGVHAPAWINLGSDLYIRANQN